MRSEMTFDTDQAIEKSQDHLLCILDERIAECEERLSRSLLNTGSLDAGCLEFPEPGQTPSSRPGEALEAAPIGHKTGSILAMLKEEGAELPTLKSDPKLVQELFRGDWDWFLHLRKLKSDDKSVIVSGDAVRKAVGAKNVAVISCSHCAADEGENLAMEVAEDGGRSFLLGPEHWLASVIRDFMAILEHAVPLETLRKQLQKTSKSTLGTIPVGSLVDQEASKDVHDQMPPLKPSWIAFWNHFVAYHSQHAGKVHLFTPKPSWIAFWNRFVAFHSSEVQLQANDPIVKSQHAPCDINESYGFEFSDEFSDDEFSLNEQVSNSLLLEQHNVDLSRINWS